MYLVAVMEVEDDYLSKLVHHFFIDLKDNRFSESLAPFIF